MHENLLRLAKETGSDCARPLESHFPVGAAFMFSNGEIATGANIEDRGKTNVGACAERSAIMFANSSFGLLSDRGQDQNPQWQVGAVWAPTPQAITPCGVCRDALAGTAEPEAYILSQCNGPSIERFSIEDLLPLAGRGMDGDVREEIHRWLERGGAISATLNAEALNLLSQAEVASLGSYIPPFCGQPNSGSVLLLEDGTQVTGSVVVEATTRLGGGAISEAVRGLLHRGFSGLPRVVRVALFTDAGVVCAPTGSDLQLLQEVRPVNGEMEIFFGNRDEKYATSLNALLPHPFGRADLGY